jgi:hypothetical protein
LGQGRTLGEDHEGHQGVEQQNWLIPGLLHLSISELQHDIFIKPSTRDLTMCELMKDAGGLGTT